MSPSSGAAPLDPAAVAVIDGYVRRLRAALGGSDALRADMLDEVRDGLLTTVEARVARGAAPTDAAGAALREFGSVAHIAAALATDLAVTRGRAVAVTMLVLAPVSALVWTVALLGTASVANSPLRAVATGGLPWRTAMPWLGPACACAAVAALIAYVTATRDSRPRPRLTYRAGLTAAITCAATDLAALTFLATWVATGRVDPVMAAVAAGVSAVRLLLIGRYAPGLLAAPRCGV